MSLAEHTGLNRACLPFHHRGQRADDGLRTRGLHLGKVTRYRLRYVRTYFRAGTRSRTGDLALTKGALVPTELYRQVFAATLARQDSNLRR